MPARFIKEYVGRGRPSAIVSEVVERETFSPDSLGYPSGHAAVAWAITINLLAYVRRPWQIAAIVMAIAVPSPGCTLRPTYRSISSAGRRSESRSRPRSTC